MKYLLRLTFLISLILLSATANVNPFSFSSRNYTLNHITYESIHFANEARPAFPIFEKALQGYYVLVEKQAVRKPILTIIDFTKSANEKRLWVIDLDKKRLLFHCLTAHGRNSGETFAHSFSNKPNSNKSSLGFFVTGSTYIGKHGTSLKLKGIEPGINDLAEARAIVMHGADYVSQDFILKYGRLGRSLGCPAVPTNLHKEIIETVANGSCLFIYHSNSEYHQQSVLGKRATGKNSQES